ncbi:hypothetical protein [Bacillus sp. T33-2]|uniref:hypothetical protein n=1 Tax=Bacillus sp. T33-2 TaxID=2054168 RepID=UPI000C7920DB|nr:hypothetical protein [Bacillus sp. T33-2]PLR94838.1 hypothetical protein CVD19_16325 [Bacillus sp. T33-2]
MIAFISEDKILIALILAIVPGTQLGLVSGQRVRGQIIITYEIHYDEQQDIYVQETIQAFKEGSLKVDAQILISKYKYVDSIARARINKFKSEK